MSKCITINGSAELHKTIKIRSAELGITVSKYLEMLVKKDIEKDTKKE